MSTITDVVEEELTLARLATRKLMGRVNGYLSVSLSGLIAKDPGSFIRGRNWAIVSLLDVISATGSTPGSGFGRKLDVLIAQLSELQAEFYGNLLHLAEWRNLEVVDIEATFASLKANYLGICENIDLLLDLLGAESDFEVSRSASRQVIEVIMHELVAARYSEQTSSLPG